MPSDVLLVCTHTKNYYYMPFLKRALEDMTGQLMIEKAAMA